MSSQNEVEEYLRKHGGKTAKEIAKALKIALTAAYRHCRKNKNIKKRYIEKTGKNRRAYLITVYYVEEKK